MNNPGLTNFNTLGCALYVNVTLHTRGTVMHLNGIVSPLLIATDKPVLHNTCFGKNVLLFVDCYTCMVFFSLNVLEY